MEVGGYMNRDDCVIVTKMSKLQFADLINLLGKTELVTFIVNNLESISLSEKISVTANINAYDFYNPIFLIICQNFR